MAFTQQHLEMLGEMGIPVWVKRTASQTESLTDWSPADETVSSVSPTVLPDTRWLVCVATNELTSAESRLLKAICKACQIPDDDWALITESQIAELPIITDQSRRVLCLDPRLWPTFQSAFASVEAERIMADAMHVIASPSLAEMLGDARLKATLWSRLKAYVEQA